MPKSDEWAIYTVDTGVPSDLAAAIAESPDADAIARAKQARRQPVTYQATSATEELRLAEEDGTLPDASMARLRIRAGAEQRD